VDVLNNNLMAEAGLTALPNCDPEGNNVAAAVVLLPPVRRFPCCGFCCPCSGAFAAAKDQRLR